MRTAMDLTADELQAIVGRVQEILFLDSDERDNRVWNRDKQWENETIEWVAEVFHAHDLVPEKGFDDEDWDSDENGEDDE